MEPDLLTQSQSFCSYKDLKSNWNGTKDKFSISEYFDTGKSDVSGIPWKA